MKPDEFAHMSDTPLKKKRKPPHDEPEHYYGVDITDTRDTRLRRKIADAFIVALMFLLAPILYPLKRVLSALVNLANRNKTARSLFRLGAMGGAAYGGMLLGGFLGSLLFPGLGTVIGMTIGVLIGVAVGDAVAKIIANNKAIVLGLTLLVQGLVGLALGSVIASAALSMALIVYPIRFVFNALAYVVDFAVKGLGRLFQGTKKSAGKKTQESLNAPFNQPIFEPDDYDEEESAEIISGKKALKSLFRLGAMGGCAYGGFLLGAIVGSLIPGPGTVIGMVVGVLLGIVVGNTLSTLLFHAKTIGSHLKSVFKKTTTRVKHSGPYKQARDQALLLRKEIKTQTKSVAPRRQHSRYTIPPGIHMMKGKDGVVLYENNIPDAFKAIKRQKASLGWLRNIPFTSAYRENYRLNRTVKNIKERKISVIKTSGKNITFFKPKHEETQKLDIKQMREFIDTVCHNPSPVGMDLITSGKEINDKFNYPDDLATFFVDKFISARELSSEDVVEGELRDNLLIEEGLARQTKEGVKLTNTGVLFFSTEPEKFLGEDYKTTVVKNYCQYATSNDLKLVDHFKALVPQ